MIVLQSVKGYKLFNCRTNDEGRRLDRVIKKMLPDVPAGLIYSGIRKGLIRVNGKKSKQSYRIEENDIIQVKEVINYAPKPEQSAEPDACLTKKLDRLVVLRTDNLIFLNKPAGILTHGPDSLAEMLGNGLSGVEDSLSFTPAPLHRLDRNTSGLLTVSLTIKGATRFSELIRKQTIYKYYIGLCLNGPKSKTRLEDNLIRNDKKTEINVDSKIKGRRAVTTAEPLIRNGRFTLCLFRIETGLTHQIRAQAAAAGFPLAGDNKYGGRTADFRGYILHSWSMLLPAHDEICGFKSVTADLPSQAMKKAGEIFGLEALEKAICSKKLEINNSNYLDI